jgi:DNA-directed RNA polymerase specialized sigma24 family protein
MAAEQHAMQSTDDPTRQQRYPEVVECTWHGRGKCVILECRYSLLQERAQVADWDPEDLSELVDALPSTCTLDLAELGGMRLEEVAMAMGMPRPRVEQLEMSAMRKLAMSRELRKIRWDGR